VAKDSRHLTRILDVVETPVDALTEFQSRKTRRLADWWLTANGGRMPSRGMFDILDHKPIVAHLFLVDVRPEGEFLFRILGEEVIRIIGRNRTGETVSRLNADEYGHELHNYYESIVAGRLCRKCTGSLEFSIGGMRTFESVDCPLADPQGDKVVAIVGVMEVLK
jgi:hypothetical protein